MAIKPGLLVEVQASFCAVPISKGRFIMLSKLRSVCVLSRQVHEVSVTCDGNNSYSETDEPIGSKRRNVRENESTSKIGREEVKEEGRV